MWLAAHPSNIWRCVASVYDPLSLVIIYLHCWLRYGTIVGAFAFTKMIGNIPAAMAVEKLGCKPVLSGTMVALGMAIGSIGLVHS